MSDIAICANCGSRKELCDSARSRGVKQPRICKDCLLNQLSTRDFTINNNYWFSQMLELGDVESLRMIKEQND